MGSGFNAKWGQFLAGVPVCNCPRSDYLPDLDGGGSARPGSHHLSHLGVFGSGGERESWGELLLGVGAFSSTACKLQNNFLG